MKVTGVIDSITSKTVGNGGTVYTAFIDGQQIDLGFRCAHSEGEFVDLDVEQTRWGLKLSQPGKKAPAQTTTSPTSASRQQFPVNPNTKDHSIIRQNALTNANTAVANASMHSEEQQFKTREDYYNEVIKVAYNLSGFAMGTLDSALKEQITSEQAHQKASLTS